jgi:hypothetical protein
MNNLPINNNVKISIATFLQSLLYLLIVFLSVLGGAIANPNLESVDFLSHVQQFFQLHGAQEVYPTLIALCIFFLGYFLARVTIIDQPPKMSDGAISTSIFFPT